MNDFLTLKNVLDKDFPFPWRADGEDIVDAKDEAVLYIESDIPRLDNDLAEFVAFCVKFTVENYDVK